MKWLDTALLTGACVALGMFAIGVADEADSPKDKDRPAARSDRPRDTEPGDRDRVDRDRRDRGRRFHNEERLFDRLDTDRDGKVTLQEAPERGKSWLKVFFERTGKASDSIVSKEEFVKVFAEQRLRGPRRERSDRDRGDRRDRGRRFSPERLFDRLDTNDDGKVTLGEAPERGKRLLENLLRHTDKGLDAELTKEEFNKLLAQRRGDGDRPDRGGRFGRRDRRPFRFRNGDRPPGPPVFRKLDTNEDGRLSKEEFAKAGELFDELDRNEDGNLNIPELFGFGPGARPPFGRGRPDARPDRPRDFRPDQPDRDRGERRGNRDRRRGAAFVERLFERFDENQDGKITKEEAPERLKARLEQVDQNEDGAITAEELRDRFSRRRDRDRDRDDRRPRRDRRPDRDSERDSDRSDPEE